MLKKLIFIPFYKFQILKKYFTYFLAHIYSPTCTDIEENAFPTSFCVPSFLYLQATSGGSSEEWGLKFALDHGRSMGWLKPNDRVVVFQKIGDSSVAKIVEFQD